MSGIFLLILLVVLLKSHPKIAFNNKEATYRYIDPPKYYNTISHLSAYDTAHFNLNKRNNYFNETYSGSYSWSWSYTEIYETPKFRRRVFHNSSKKAYYNPLWNLH